MTTADRYHALAAQHAYERRAADTGPAALIEPYLGHPAALLPQQRRSTENQEASSAKEVPGRPGVGTKPGRYED